MAQFSHEDRPLSAGLDYYKPTMSQLAFEREPEAQVSFALINRGPERLLDYVDPSVLQQRLDGIRARGWSQRELDFLGTIRNGQGEPLFTQAYLDYLRDNPLPSITVGVDPEANDLTVTPDIDGKEAWALSTFWETVVLSELNEAYFEGYLTAHNIDPNGVYDEGDRRLSEKIAILQANPDIKFADFGTRRRFSLKWQAHVLERLLNECPDNIVGTSNVALADHFGIKPIGTFAHEMPMAYAGLADARGQDIRASHHRLLQHWFGRYGEDLSIVLTDTFTTKFFFSDFTPEQAAQWRGVRQDSGDPREFGERLIEFYESVGVDPREKTVVFSDSLDIDSIVELHQRFKGRIKVLFGWGTTLTNDLGIPALNIVMKATHVRLPTGEEADLVKFSDSRGKYLGPAEKIALYMHEFGLI